MIKRRIPSIKDIFSQIGSPNRNQSALERKLSYCADIWDIRALAKKKVPPLVFDYTDGAAGCELSLKRSRDAYARVEFMPKVLRDVSQIDLSVDILGTKSALPYCFAPTGFTRMMHYMGEFAVSNAAKEFNLIYVLSTLGTISIEDLANHAPDLRKWFQLYVSKEKEKNEALLSKAEENGYEAVILTVDTPVGGIRNRDIRNGLTIPPQINLKALLQITLYPKWWFNLITTDSLEFATLKSSKGTVSDLLSSVFDSTVSFDDLKILREMWNKKLIVKGVQSIEDAKKIADLGVDAIIISNHGGRQLDKANVPLEVLPDIVNAVRDKIEVYVDGGIMTGSDIVTALAFGARAVFLGRAYLYGIMAGGEAGVKRVINILNKEITTTMQLIGASSINELHPEMVKLRKS